MNFKYQSITYFAAALLVLSIGYVIKDKPEAFTAAVGFLVIGHIYRAAEHFEKRKQL